MLTAINQTVSAVVRYARHYAECVVSVLGYLKARMAEPATWASIVAGIAGVSALNPPWDKIAFGCAVIGVLLPSPKANS